MIFIETLSSLEYIWHFRQKLHVFTLLALFQMNGIPFIVRPTQSFVYLWKASLDFSNSHVEIYLVNGTKIYNQLAFLF